MRQSVYGLDIAKKVFQIHSVDANTGAPIRLKLSRDELLPYFEQADSSIVAMEACGLAYFWAEQLSLQVHDARLLPPLYVWPFRKANKNDASDAHAIWEAAQRPEMRFVSIRSNEHRAVLATLKVRKQLVEHRAAYVNQLHGIFTEFGVALPRNWGGMLPIARAILDSDAALSFPPKLCATLKAAIQAIDDLTVQINSLTSVLERWQQSSEECRRIGEVPGVCVVTAI